VLGVATHINGSLGFATSTRAILELDAAPRLPGLSVAPRSLAIRVGLSVRASDFTSYGPFADVDVRFFEDLHLIVRATALIGLRSTVDADRVITSRTGVDLYAGAGYGFRVFRGPRVMPHLGAALFMWRENATSFTSGVPSDSSGDRSSIRLTPGLSMTAGPFMIDYKMEIDFGDVGASAHVLSGAIRFF
jgi:hypothetical protein